MKIIAIAILLSVTVQAHAESIPVGCVAGSYGCYQRPNGQNKCSWLYDIGKVIQVDLSKAGSAPTYDVFEGKISGKFYQKYDFRLVVAQQREATQARNFLKVEIDINGITVIATGENTAEAAYFDSSKNFGVGLHCSTDISPTP